MPSTLEPTEGWIVAERREPPGESWVFRSAIPDGLRRSATKETALGVSRWTGSVASRQHNESLDDFRYLYSLVPRLCLGTGCL